MAAGRSLSPKRRTVISTEAAHDLCEQRSGEIRFSTQILLGHNHVFAFAFALPLPAPLPLPLPSPVLAVILSAAKDPEDLDPPPLSGPFQPDSQPLALDHRRNNLLTPQSHPPAISGRLIATTRRSRRGLLLRSQRVLQTTCIALRQSDSLQSRAWPSLHRCRRSRHAHRKQSLLRQLRPHPPCLRRQPQRPSRHRSPSLHRNVRRSAHRSLTPTARFQSPQTTPASIRSFVKSPPTPASRSQAASQMSASSANTDPTAQLEFSLHYWKAPAAT
jgi:hypothetical protein